MIKIPNFSRYVASEDGHIYSLNYKNSGKTKILKPALSRDGYLRTMIQNDQGKYVNTSVHKMIALAYHGERPLGLEINHINGIKTDNSPINLEYVTRSQNCQHSFDIGLQKPKKGELNGWSKLTNEQVLHARELKRTKGRFWGRNELAKEFGISPKHLQKIVNEKHGSWNHI